MRWGYFIVQQDSCCVTGGHIQPVKSWDSEATEPRVSGFVTTGPPSGSPGVTLFPRLMHSTHGAQHRMEAFDLKCPLHPEGWPPPLEGIGSGHQGTPPFYHGLSFWEWVSGAATGSCSLMPIPTPRHPERHPLV